MRLRSLRVEKEPKLMIIPMIDIIFFLLVFFYDEHAQYGGAEIHQPESSPDGHG